jgi:hypothetical protein
MTWRYRLRRQLVFLRHLFWEAYRERILLSIVATVCFGCLIAILNHIYAGTNFWNQFDYEKDIEYYFCEYTDMHTLIRQPINTFTNFVYLIICIFSFSKGLEDIKRKRAYNLITANRFYSFTLAAIAFYTFASSTLFHSSLIEFCSKMDFSAVYSITLFPLMYFTHRVTLRMRGKPSNVRYSRERLVLIAIFSAIYVAFTLTLNMHIVHPAVGSIIVLTLGFGVYLERKDPGNTNKDYLIATIVTILLAGLFFELDIKHILCNNYMHLTPHSLWHLFNGAAIFFFYLYIRSEGYDHMQDDLRLAIKQKVEAKLSKRAAKN